MNDGVRIETEHPPCPSPWGGMPCFKAADWHWAAGPGHAPQRDVRAHHTDERPAHVPERPDRGAGTTAPSEMDPSPLPKLWHLLSAGVFASNNELL